MSQQAQQRIVIFSHHLDAALFDYDAYYEVIKALAIKNRRTHIHILLQDVQPMIRKGHRLLNLARRISSHITIKLTATEHQDILETFILFDDRGYIIQTHPERYDGMANFYDPLKTRQLGEQFEQLWAQASIPGSLRRLSL